MCPEEHCEIQTSPSKPNREKQIEALSRSFPVISPSDISENEKDKKAKKSRRVKMRKYIIVNIDR